jgi:inhibitor of the pro-sigma K processing machinery
MSFGLGSGIVSALLLLIGIVLVVFIVFKLGKFILGLIVNIILGFIAILLLNSIFGLGIPWNWLVIVITAILGLPGVLLIVILKFLGVVLFGMPV